jgi:perosamine synthetase
LSLGPELATFEAAFAAFHSVPHAIACSSGTAGLHMALLTLGIGETDEVIIPSFAFIAVANSVLHAGATPVFADVDATTLNLTAASVEPLITPRTRAILVVHTFGVPANMVDLRALVARHNLFLIEDACEAIGAELNDARVGTFGDLSVFGFYPNKQMTTGEGGAVLTRSQFHADRLRSLRNQGRTSTPSQDETGAWLQHAEIGFNYRLSDIACALGSVQLSRIEEILARRRAAAENYHALLSGIPGLELPPLSAPSCSISWFVYVVRLPQDHDRAKIQASLARHGISSATYFSPIHQQPAWRGRVSQPQINLPVTVSVGRRTLALPFFTRISSAQQEKVAQVLQTSLAP